MPPEPLILGFDTSAAHCAAALVSGGKVLTHVREDMARGQAERLMPLLEEVLADQGATWGDLSAIGVGIGPGNFTGIRISVAAARGLALSLGIPAVGVSALEAQAHGLPGVVVSSLDARREMLYMQVLGDGSGTGPELCSMERLPEIPAGADPLCVGHMADEIAARCAGTVTAPTVEPAEAIALIAETRRGGAARPAPLYIRPADAAPPRDAGPVILP